MTPFANLSETGGPTPTANDSIDDFIDQGGVAVLQYLSIGTLINTRSFAAFDDPQSISFPHPEPCSEQCLFTSMTHNPLVFRFRTMYVYKTTSYIVIQF